jgi:hypothetical protein
MFTDERVGVKPITAKKLRFLTIIFLQGIPSPPSKKNNFNLEVDYIFDAVRNVQIYVTNIYLT